MGTILANMKYHNYGSLIGTSKSGISVFKSAENGMTTLTSIKDPAIVKKGFWNNLKAFFASEKSPIKEIFKHPKYTTVMDYKDNSTTITESFFKDKTKVIYKRDVKNWKPFYFKDKLMPKSLKHIKQIGKEEKQIIYV